MSSQFQNEKKHIAIVCLLNFPNIKVSVQASCHTIPSISSQPRFIVQSRKLFPTCYRTTLHGVESREACHLDGLHTGFGCREPKKNVTFQIAGCLCHKERILVRQALAGES